MQIAGHYEPNFIKKKIVIVIFVSIEKMWENVFKIILS